MAFLAPLLLLAGLSLAVPLILHLWQRQETETESFPALRYLLTSTRERDRTLRLRQLLLLLTRLALLAVLTLAAARLVLPVGGRDHPPGALVVVVDNGIASGRVVEGERVLDRLRSHAREAVGAAGAADRIWILPVGEPWRTAFPTSPAGADSLLARLEPTPVRGDLGATLARAEALLAAADEGPSQILLLSELRDVDPTTLPALRTPILLAEVELPDEEQRGIAEVRVGGGLPPRAGDPSEVEVRVAGANPEGVAVRVHLEDELVAAGRTDERGWGVFPLPALEEGWRSGWVEIDPDALRTDDRVDFVLRVRPAPTVALTGPPLPFVQEALETLEAAGRIRRSPAGEAQVLLLSGDAALPSPATTPPLTVLLPPRDPSLLPALNLWLEALGSAWRLGPDEAPQEAERRVAPESSGFPRTLADVPLRWRVRLEGPEGGVLLRTTDGAPWVVEEPLGEDGRIRILASPLDRTSSDLPLSAAMLPFLDRLLDPAEGAGIPTTVEAGHPIPLPPEVRRAREPDGTSRTADGIPSLLGTGRTGVWDLLDAQGATLGRVAVRPAPPPGPRVGAGPVAEALAGEGAEVRTVSGPVPWDREVLAHRRGREVAPALAILALLLLVAEGWLAAPDGGLRSWRPGRPT